jgi:C1A family cysteine protease
MSNYAKGHVRRPDKDHLIALSHARHGDRLQHLRGVVLPASYDARTQGLIGPIKDQEQCGSCWDFSGTGCVEVAYNKAGIGGGANVFILSEEYTLSCYRNGKCNGDDNTTVLDWAKTHGLPLTAEYGPYKGAPGKCLYKPKMPLYKIDDWGFADGNGGSGVTPTPDIKSAIFQYGAVGCAVAADDAFQAYTGGVFQSTESDPNQIDHDVMLVGWNDTDGAWILRNTWTTAWGEAGYMRIAYGANLVGTEAVWAVKNAA